ncbi:glycosyltransferase involved in cell wall biosynthesis [Fontibacillus phaseoli]|uniref:Glycosyltransferase involved in cell wall biosynthesis n=1 Tax=Fontibacillus phaseoli TaxID=1416533 RepID=A0A369BP98_9BACL|nr:glycosyltransferase family 4 protein [Fontibacillus phaseoli]RCX21494.1 glycosyltransferase involved in cell wall biosynthesis [Fontibacillus phaseoli]
MTSSYQVVWKGPVNRRSGLGIASRGYVRALRAQGVNVTLREQNTHFPKNRKVLIYHHSPSTLNIEKERQRYGKIIINTVWETTRIPQRWIRPINQADAVCVPSLQNKQAMLNSGIKVPIYIVPHGVHSQMYKPTKKRMPSKISKEKFTFISIFGFQHRKNPEALLRAYWEEFSSADNVRLIIKTNGYSSNENEQWIRRQIHAYKAILNISKNTAPIEISTRYLTTKSLRSIYAKGHAFVLPTRGEGVGLPLLESLASGVPVITTGWGGHMDYLTERSSFLVKYKLRPPTVSLNRKSSISHKFRSLFSEKGQLWAEADLGNLKRQMRRAYENPQLCLMKGQRGRKDVLSLSWNRAGSSLKRVIEEVIRKRK